MNPQLKSAVAEAQASLGKVLKHESTATDQSPGLQEAYQGLTSALRVVESSDRTVPSQAIELYQLSSQQAKQVCTSGLHSNGKLTCVEPAVARQQSCCDLRQRSG